MNKNKTLRAQLDQSLKDGKLLFTFYHQKQWSVMKDKACFDVYKRDIGTNEVETLLSCGSLDQVYKVLPSEGNIWIRGSQVAEDWKTSGYSIVERGKGRVILTSAKDKSDKKHWEIWHLNSHHAGYTIFIGNAGYEYGCDWRD